MTNRMNVRLAVYDILGKEVAVLLDGVKNAGEHAVLWDADNVGSGVYFYKLSTSEFTETRKMLLLK